MATYKPRSLDERINRFAEKVFRKISKDDEFVGQEYLEYIRRFINASLGFTTCYNYFSPKELARFYRSEEGQSILRKVSCDDLDYLNENPRAFMDFFLIFAEEPDLMPLSEWIELSLGIYEEEPECGEDDTDFVISLSYPETTQEALERLKFNETPHIAFDPHNPRTFQRRLREIQGTNYQETTEEILERLKF